MSRYFPVLLILFIVLGAVAYVPAQEDDSMFPGRARKEDPPHGLEEALTKLRIDKEKKEFNEMVKRGDDAAKLANDLKEASGLDQREQITSIGKLVKKIRDELGGESEKDDEVTDPSSEADAIKSLKAEVNALAEDLRKATRFTISADAIDRTNTITRLIKYLHG